MFKILKLNCRTYETELLGYSKAKNALLAMDEAQQRFGTFRYPYSLECRKKGDEFNPMHKRSLREAIYKVDWRKKKTKKGRYDSVMSS